MLRRPTPRSLLALAFAAPWVLWAVVRVFGLERGHPLVGAIAFTPYVAATAWLPLLAALALRSRAVAALSFGAAVALVAVVAPRALEGPQAPVAGGRDLTVMTANLARGRGDAEAVMALVRANHVDVLSLQELTPEAALALDRAGARERFPYRLLEARPGAQGLGLMSRYRLEDAVDPPDTELDMPHATLAMPGAAAIEVVVVHPVPPLRRDVALWRSQLRELPRATPSAQLRMLVGDFNATLDHEELRALVSSGYVDAGDAAGIGLEGTYRSGSRLPPPIAIDHVLVDGRARVTGASVHAIARSDHRAVVASLSVPPR